MVLQISPPDGQRPNLSVRDAVIRQLFCGDRTVGNFDGATAASRQSGAQSGEIGILIPVVEQVYDILGRVVGRVVGYNEVVDFKVEVICLE